MVVLAAVTRAGLGPCLSAFSLDSAKPEGGACGGAAMLPEGAVHASGCIPGRPPVGERVGIVLSAGRVPRGCTYPPSRQRPFDSRVFTLPKATAEVLAFHDGLAGSSTALTIPPPPSRCDSLRPTVLCTKTRPTRYQVATVFFLKPYRTSPHRLAAPGFPTIELQSQRNHGRRRHEGCSRSQGEGG
jgi:hypothetical protein